MAKGIPFNLDSFKKNADGSYSKISNPQPRDKKKILQKLMSDEIDSNILGYPVSAEQLYKQYPLTEEDVFQDDSSTALGLSVFTKKEREITLNLFGIPMPKQSVIGGANGFYQPKEKTDRKKDYILQILSQLPKGFKPFEHEVHCTKFHCVYPPLKAFHKQKGKMERIRNGEIFYKTTQPDLIDNLKKLIYDSMAGIVLKNDGLVVTENNTAKYYGTGGCIIITLKGY